MGIIIAVPALTIVWWCIFHLQKLGALAPHHVEATPGKWSTLVKSGITLFALLLIPGLHETKPEWVPFFAMFVLAQTVAVAFTSPDRPREDEEPDSILRVLEPFKSAIAGAVMAKVLSIILAFLTAWLIGDWWFVALMLIGFALISDKSATALQVIEAENGEFSSLSEKQRIEKRDHWVPVIVKGNIAYVVGCSTFGFTLFQFANLDPSNWMGWSGLIGGAVVNAALSGIQS